MAQFVLQRRDGVAHFLHQPLRLIVQAYRTGRLHLPNDHQLRLAPKLLQLLLGEDAVRVVGALGAVDDATATKAIGLGLDRYAHG
ncbi:hypothetical protein D3C79_1012160 [compost metagenome]